MLWSCFSLPAPVRDFMVRKVAFFGSTPVVVTARGAGVPLPGPPAPQGGSEPPPTHGVVERGVEPHELQQVLEDLLRRPGHHQVPGGRGRGASGKGQRARRAIPIPLLRGKPGWGCGAQPGPARWPRDRRHGVAAPGRRDGDRRLSPAALRRGRLAAAALQVLLQDQHHLPVLLQAHGVGLHVLEGVGGRGKALPPSPAWAGTGFWGASGAQPAGCTPKITSAH